MAVKELKVKNKILEYFKNIDKIKNINKIVKKYDIVFFFAISNLMNFSAKVCIR
jgi:hypothetical protein